MATLIKDFDILLQIVCDPENQPHQFIDNEKGFKKAFEIHLCECKDPPELSNDDKIIRLCGKCNGNVI